MLFNVIFSILYFDIELPNEVTNEMWRDGLDIINLKVNFEIRKGQIWVFSHIQLYYQKLINVLPNFSASSSFFGVIPLLYQHM